MARTWITKVNNVDTVDAAHVNDLQTYKLDKDELPYVRPEDYGAVGDGVTDDTAAIQAATDACVGAWQGATGEGILYNSFKSTAYVLFGPKTYRVNSTLNNKGVPWRGSGMSNTFIDFRGSTVAVNAVGADDTHRLLISISDMSILGDGASAGTIGIKFGYNERSVAALSRVMIYGFPSWAIYFEAYAYILSFYDVYIDDCGYGGTGTGAIGVNPACPAYAVNAMSWYNLVIEECGVAGSGYGSVHVPATTAGDSCVAINWGFYGGTFEGNKGYGNFYLEKAQGFLISGVYTEDLTAADFVTSIYCDSSSLTVIGSRILPLVANVGSGITAVTASTLVLAGNVMTGWGTNVSVDVTSKLIDLKMDGNLNVTGDYQIDGVALAQKDVVGLTTGDEPVFSTVNNSALTNTVIPYQRATAEYVANGGFDSDTTDWAVENCTIASVAGGQAGNCLELTRVSGVYQRAYQVRTNLIVGRIYTFSAYVKSGTSGNELFFLECNRNVDSGDDHLVSGTSSGAWTKYSITFTPNIAAYNFYLYKYTATPGTMLFDTVSISTGEGLSDSPLSTDGTDVDNSGVYKVDAVQVVGPRVIDARCDDAINSGDATTDGVIDALRDAMIAHGLIAAA